MGTEGEVTVQSLDAYGRGGATYFYYDLPGELTGWLDGLDNEVQSGSVLISAGEGLWISSPNSAYGLQTSGQVPTSDISVVLRQGNKLVVNSTPISVDMTDMDVSGYDAEVGTEGEVTVQSLDAFGRGGATYFYYDLPGELTGWLDGLDNEVQVGAVTVAPGNGLWASSPSTAFSIILPGVTL